MDCFLNHHEDFIQNKCTFLIPEKFYRAQKSKFISIFTDQFDFNDTITEYIVNRLACEIIQQQTTYVFISPRLYITNYINLYHLFITYRVVVCVQCTLYTITNT